jgi:hypothetical protein
MALVKKTILLVLLPTLLFAASSSAGADESDSEMRKALDSEYIAEIENPKNEVVDKVLHAEPLYIDLIRDLGARAGELEVNLGYGVQDKREFARFEYLAEIEWAPFNRLGIELELPFSQTTQYAERTFDQPRTDGMNSVKAAAQYTFFVSEPYATSAAVGYLHEFLRAPALADNSGAGFVGNLYNPFFVIAHRWTNNWHTLLYAGPRHTAAIESYTTWENNLSFHYMLSGTRHFIGLEMNQEIAQKHNTITYRPQIRLQLSHNLLIGLVVGVPDNMRRNGMSSFVRLIYEIS